MQLKQALKAAKQQGLTVDAGWTLLDGDTLVGRICERSIGDFHIIKGFDEEGVEGDVARETARLHDEFASLSREAARECPLPWDVPDYVSRQARLKSKGWQRWVPFLGLYRIVADNWTPQDRAVYIDTYKKSFIANIYYNAIAASCVLTAACVGIGELLK